MVIGFRSFPDGFAYVVLRGSQAAPEVVANDRLCLPENHSWPACLSWVRKQLSELLQKHDANAACIKTIEPMARKKDARRLHIEAVMQEYLYTAHSINCSTRIKSQLRRDIIDFSDPARYVQKVLTECHVLADLNSSQYQEATLAAVSELPGE